MDGKARGASDSNANQHENRPVQPQRDPYPFSIRSILGPDILERDSGSESEEHSTSSNSSTCSSSPDSPEKAAEAAVPTPINALQEFTCRAFEGSRERRDGEGEWSRFCI